METEKKKTKIADLDLPDWRKAQLSFLIKQRQIAEFAAKFDYDYGYVSQILRVWAYKGWIKRIKTAGGKIYYKLNQDELEI